MSSLSFLITLFWTQYLIVDLPLSHLVFFLRIPPFLWLEVVSLPSHYLWDSSYFLLLVKFICFDSLSFWCEFYGRRPVRFKGAVSLITWTSCSWDALYAVCVGSLDVTGFWLLLSCSLVGSSLQLVDWGSLHPPHLAVVQVLLEQNHKTQETNPHPQKYPPTHTILVSTANEPGLTRV